MTIIHCGNAGPRIVVDAGCFVSLGFGDFVEGGRRAALMRPDEARKLASALMAAADQIEAKP